MVIEKVKITNYKCYREKTIFLNKERTIFVGGNDVGKSTILEAISLVLTRRLDGKQIDYQLRSSLFNNECRQNYLSQISNPQDAVFLPEIVVEAYMTEGPEEYKGTNNSNHEDVIGIQLRIFFNQDYEKEYNQLRSKGLIKDIPIEYYKVEWKDFSGSLVSNRSAKICSFLIDASRKNASGVVKDFVRSSIDEYLTLDEKTNIALDYRQFKQNFANNLSLEHLSESINQSDTIPNHRVSFTSTEVDQDDWMDDVFVNIDDLPFENLGFGTQNIIKVELALRNQGKGADVVLIDEPENNLSYISMHRLMDYISRVKADAQIVITTHSSFIANRLSLNNVTIVGNEIISFSSLDKDSCLFFEKLPNYDTLRFAISEVSVLVEGPTDCLVFERAYKDNKGKWPIEDGVAVISVGSLSFKHYCNIAKMLRNKVIIITDNDGDIQTNICKKYEDYIDKFDNIKIFYDKDVNNNTLEPSIISVNSDGKVLKTSFVDIVCKRSGTINSFEDLNSFMQNNKVAWAMRVYEAIGNISYPQYLLEAINECN